MISKKAIILLSLLIIGGQACAQESVFNGLKGDSKRADRFYSLGTYKNALDLYLSAENKKNSPQDLNLKIARTYFQLKDYENSARWYDKYASLSTKFSDDDLYMYAEALRSSVQYKKAIIYYKRYQNLHPEDKSIDEKIWRLSNIQYLLEDSMHYSIKKANIDAPGSQYSPVFYNEGIVFVANKRASGGIVSIDGINNTEFKTLYLADVEIDTINSSADLIYTNIREFSRDITSKYNTGSITFFPGSKKMIFSKNSIYNHEKGSYLQLFVAELRDGIWQEVKPLPFNSSDYSVSNPSLDDEGNTLYFASNMPGGYGKKDLYVSYFIDNTWSKPENLGSGINTSGDEGHPYIHNSTLYFSSNGHGGLGGLDIYRIDSRNLDSDELVTIGYPLNSSFDDFGIALNDQGTNGFISSNRLNGGFEDYIYEVEIDLQSYPLTIKGTVKYKELSWRESHRHEVLKNAELLLIDSNKMLQVSNSKTDSLGYFELEIPYASNYTLKIVSPVIGDKRVKLEVPKNKRLDSVHDIVIIKDKLNTGNNDSNKTN